MWKMVCRSPQSATSRQISDGQITVEGPYRDALATTVLAVTGGTGRYANARGQMVLHLRGDGNFDFVFRLQP